MQSDTRSNRPAATAFASVCVRSAWRQVESGAAYAAAALWLLHCSFGADPSEASCDVVPAIKQEFPSTLGSVSTPFARPNDEVVLVREAEVFSSTPAQNRVSILFTPPDGGPASLVDEVATLPPEDGTGCEPSECVGSLCRCLRFRFPDTDAEVGAPDDGRTLSGPVVVRARRDGDTTALIEALFVPGTGFRDDVFPTFTALPVPTRFADLLVGGAAALAAVDGGDNLLIPLDFDALVPGLDPLGVNNPRTRFVEATVPGLEGLGASPLIDSFTPEGRRLPPLIQPVGQQGLLGTIDVRESVLRVEDGALAPNLAPAPGNGLVEIPNVTGFADPRKRADSFMLQVGDRFAVYENRECNQLGSDFDCVDVNFDGDTTDYFLQAFDVTVPQAPPLTIDDVDGADFPGFPNTFPPAFLYVFAASDELVAFRIPELSFDGRVVDIDGNGSSGDLVRSGVFDLRNELRILEAEGSPRHEIADNLVAFSVELLPPFGPDLLMTYDTGRPDLGARVVPPGFVVTRFPMGISVLPSNPFDLAVRDGKVAFVVPEAIQGVDLTGDGTLGQQALLLFNDATGLVTNPQQQTEGGVLQLTTRWLTFLATRIEETFISLPVGLLAVEQPLAPPRFLCDEPFGIATIVASISDSLIGCVKDETLLFGFPPRDLNGDGDTDDLSVLHVFSPDAPGGGIEQNLGLALVTEFDPVLSRETLAVPISELRQRRDLDGDGEVGGLPPFGGSVLHVFNGLTREVANFGFQLVPVGPPILRFVDRGLVAHLPDPAVGPTGLRRAILRDTDGDQSFEEQLPDPETREAVLHDNCPTVANPDQADSDGDGIGDLCECPPLEQGEACAVFLPCQADVQVEGARIRMTGLGGADGDEGLILRGRLPAEAGVFSDFDPASILDGGVELVVEDLGSVPRVLVDLSRRTALVPAGLPGQGCGPRDGWGSSRRGTRLVYENRSNALPSAGCAAGSAQGLRRLEIIDRRALMGAIDFRVRLKQADLGPSGGPLRATIALGGEVEDPGERDCASHVFFESSCRRGTRTGMTCD